MTIEQKAAAYDRALEVLKKYDGANIMFSQDLKEEMFPELKKKAYIDKITERLNNESIETLRKLHYILTIVN